MGEIKISYAELENKILELREVRSSWGSYNKRKKPEISGSGKTAIMADEIAELYLKLYDSVCRLCDNSISYLENIKNNINDTDEELANAFKE